MGKEGSYLFAARRAVGLSQEELAERSGLSVRNISNIERGQVRRPRRGSLEALADALGLNPDERRSMFDQYGRGTPAPRQERNFLPHVARRLIGRHDEADRIGELIAAEPDGLVCGIDGMAGVGKTAFAVRVARDLTPRYPDGQFFVDFHGWSVGARPLDAGAALAILLRQAGVSGGEIPGELPARAARWHSELSGCRALVVLDNVTTEEQIRPLIPASPGCLTLITSRRRLIGLEEVVPLSLGTLSHGDSVTLFASSSGADPADPVLDDVVRRCAHLPLAIRIAAARLRHRPAWTPADLLNRLRALNILVELGAGDQSVKAAFEMSYGQLEPGLRRAFRLLGVQPMTTFDAYAASALLDVTLDESDRLLERLVDVHLIEQSGADRYRFHDLVKLHARMAAEIDEAATARRDAIRRLLDYLLHVAVAADREIGTRRRDLALAIIQPPAAVPPVGESEAAAMGWLETERANLLAAIEFAAGHGWTGHAWQLARTLIHYFERGWYREDWITSHELALDATRRAPDPLGEAFTLINLNKIFQQVGRVEEAHQLALRSLEIFADLGDRHGQAVAWCGLGHAHRRMGEYASAARYFSDAIAVSSEGASTLERLDRAINQQNLAMVHERTSQYEEARRLYTAALDTFTELNERVTRTITLRGLGVVHARLGDYPAATVFLSRALAMARAMGDRHKEGHVLAALGALYVDVDRPRDAVGCLLESLEVLRAVGGTIDRIPALMSLGAAYTKLARYEEAMKHHRQAIGLAVELRFVDLEAEVLNNTGETHFRTGNVAASRRCHEEALRIADRIGLSREAARARHRLSLLAEQVDADKLGLDVV